MQDNKKIYILQKDLPDAKVGQIYRWYNSTDGYGKERRDESSYTDSMMNTLKREVVENNPDWFKPKEEERTKVLELRQVNFNMKHYEFKLSTNYSVPSLAPLLKAIESVVNDDKKYDVGKMYDYVKKVYEETGKLFYREGSDVKNEEKNWEILTCKHDTLSKSLLKDIIVDKTSPHFNKAITDSEYSIHSVLRKSDNVVFTVGDIVSRNNFNDKICGFNIDDNYIKAKFCDGETCAFFNLSELSFTKPILFTTEDGKDIYKDECAFYVEEKNNFMIVSHSGIQEKSPHKYFSTKEKAEEYILLNKPCLSLNDLLSVWDKGAEYGRKLDCNVYKESPLYKNFEQLVKDKISK